METLYIKVNGKYKKIGCTANTNYIFDGLWLVQSHDNSKEYNNILVRLNDLPSHIDVQEYLKCFLNKETIIKAIKELEKSKNILFYNVSVNDFAEEIIKQMFLNTENKPKRKVKK